MRVFASDAYGIPPDQIVGSMGKLKYEMQNGNPVLIKLPEVLFIDDKQGKPVGVEAGSQPWIRTAEQSSLLTHIVATIGSALLCVRMNY
jgi:hypothetical protein